MKKQNIDEIIITPPIPSIWEDALSSEAHFNDRLCDDVLFLLTRSLVIISSISSSLRPLKPENVGRHAEEM